MSVLTPVSPRFRRRRGDNLDWINRNFKHFPGFLEKSKKVFAFKSYRLYRLMEPDPNRRLAMTAAFAPSVADVSAPHPSTPSGAQNLLTLKPARQFYLAEALAVVLYALALWAGLYYKAPPIEVPPEEPIELVMEPAAEPPPPPPLPEVVPPQPEEPPPPPPAAIEPPVAPVEPIKPKPIVKVQPKIPPKIQPKPQPVHERVERAERVEHKPQAAPQHAVARPQAAAPARPVPAGASASAIANQIHGCLARAGAALYPENQKPRSAHVSYHASISASGSVSYGWGSSGNPAFDSAAQRAASRCGHVDAPGHPATFSGAINFSYH
jgi:protein TonB